MASQYFGLNRGASSQPDEVSVGTSTNATDVEVRIDLTKGWTRAELDEYLSRIKDFILDGRNDLLKL